MERFSRRDGRVAAAEAGCTFDLPPHSLLFCEVGGPSRPARPTRGPSRRRGPSRGSACWMVGARA